MKDEKILGAQSAREDVSAGSIAPESATARHTPGPWAWFGNTKNKELHLATTHSGRQFVMTFARYGMQSGQPRFQVGHRMVDAHDLVVYERDYRADVCDINHPDAHLIAAAPELKDVCAQLVEFQRVYALNTHDTAPGNRHYSEMLMRVVARASAALAKAEGRS